MEGRKEENANAPPLIPSSPHHYITAKESRIREGEEKKKWAVREGEGRKN